MIDQITNHTDVIKQDLKGQFWASERFKELLGIFATQIQDLEDLGFDFVGKLNLDNATGVLLDRMGLLIGLPRGDLTDDALYAKCLTVKMASNQSHGLMPKLLELLAILIDGTIRYIQQVPRWFTIDYEVSARISESFLYWINFFIKELLPIGTGYSIVEGKTPVFRFDSGPGFDQGGWGSIVGGTYE